MLQHHMPPRFRRVKKANPNHDELGRFAEAPRGAGPIGIHYGGQLLGRGTGGSGTRALREPTDREIAEASKYMNEGYIPLNRALRNGTTDGSMAEQLSTLDDYCQSGEFKENRTTYRAIDLDTASSVLDSLEVGDELIDRGYTSVSADLQGMNTFVRGEEQLQGKHAIMEISVAKGTKVGPITQFAGDIEHELLLPRGGRYRFMGIPKHRGIHKTYAFELVGNVRKANPNHDERGRFAEAPGEPDIDETETVAFYTRSGYSGLNKQLRNTGFDGLSDFQKKSVERLDRFTSRNETGKDMRVFRMMGGADAAQMFGDAEKGTTVVDPAYMSTTPSRKALRSVSDNFTDWPHAILEIRVPEGTKYGGVSKHSSAKFEKEMLFPRGTRLVFSGKAGTYSTGPSAQPVHYWFDMEPPEGVKKYNPNHDEIGRFSEGKGSLSRAPRDRKDWPPHIAALRVPPAWTSIRINPDPEGNLLVVGKDAKGRDQYVYSERFAQSQAAAKYERIRELQGKFDKISDQNRVNERHSDPIVREHAEITSVIMETGIRPGSDRATGGETQAYGATTLEGRHVVTKGGTTTLEFTGKSGVSLSLPVENKHVAGILKDRAESAGRDGRLFPNVSSSSLLGYTDDLNGGSFRPKDFRTALGTRTAVAELGKLQTPTTPSAYKRAVRSVAAAVAKRLGNTPTVALQSYIDPTIFGGWRRAARI